MARLLPPAGRGGCFLVTPSYERETAHGVWRGSRLLPATLSPALPYRSPLLPVIIALR
jgi:hypothetical protein